MRSILIGLAFFLCFTGCARRAPIAKTPYQQSVEAYYRDLDSNGGKGPFPESEKALAVALQANPADIEARVLRANVYAIQAGVGNDAVAREKLAADLKALNYGMQGVTPADWVRPRILIIVGDLMLRDGNRLLSKEISPTDTPKTLANSIQDAKARFQEASRYYASAHASASSAASPSFGALQEKSNALSGYVQALRGVMDSLSQIQNDPELMLSLRERTLSALNATLTNGTISVTADTTIGVDPLQLQAAAATFRELANLEQKKVTAWCKSNPGSQPPAAKGQDLLIRAIDVREREHGKQVALDTLAVPSAAAAGTLDRLSDLYQGLAAFCNRP